MRVTKRTLLAGVLALAAGVLPSPWSGSAALAWEPQKPVEFVIMAGRGGGADKMARLMQQIIEKNGWCPQPLSPSNKPGGSGAEALVHLKGKASSDPDHTIMVTLNSFYTTPLRQPGLDIDVAEYTPIARMAEDTFLLWVHKESDITSLEDFVAAAKEAGSGWRMAGTGNLQEDQLLTDLLNLAYGLDMKYVPYRGGGTVAKQLAEKRANSTVNNPSEQESFHASGLTVPIAVFTSERLSRFPDTPTFRELGKDFVYLMQRSVVGPPGMNEAAASYYQDLFKKVYESEEWQDYRRAKSLYGDFLSGQALMDYWMDEREIHRAMLTEMGVL